MISINEHSPNSNTSDDYKYYEVKNVTNYNYHDFSSYRINIRENAYTPDTNTRCLGSLNNGYIHLSPTERSYLRQRAVATRRYDARQFTEKRAG